MDEYIEREAVLEIFRKKSVGTFRALPCYSDEIRTAYREVGKLPAADVAPAVNGEWESHYEVVDGEIRISASKRVCSACKDIWESSGFLPHCPGCGAKMMGGEKQMTDRERLVELVDRARKEAAQKCHGFMSCKECPNQDDNNQRCRNAYIAESLIKSGVTVPVSEPPKGE